MAITVPSANPAAGSVLFQGRANAAQTLTTANTYWPISLQVEDFDDLDGHSTTTNTSRYVAKRAGVYSVAGIIWLPAGTAATTNTQTRIAAILKNGSVIPYSPNPQTYYGLVMAVPTMPALVTLAVNDYVELAGFSGLANTPTAADANGGSVLRVDFVR